MSQALTCSPMSIEPSSPYAATLGLTRSMQDGRTVLTMPGAPGLQGRPGFLHGGAIAGLLENAAWAVAREALPADATIKPVSVTVDFLRGAGMETPTHAHGEIVRRGRRITTVLATAWQHDRAKPIATARMTLMIENAA
ncbi:MAG: PaaI family thioesterase [Sphingomonadaceae bacterium]